MPECTRKGSPDRWLGSINCIVYSVKIRHTRHVGTTVRRKGQRRKMEIIKACAGLRFPLFSQYADTRNYETLTEIELYSR